MSAECCNTDACFGLMDREREGRKEKVKEKGAQNGNTSFIHMMNEGGRPGLQ